MRNLESFLSNLSDLELAILIAYRYEGFLEGSKNKIILETKKRGLTSTELKRLFDKGLPIDKNATYCCPQCNSSKTFIEHDTELRQHKYGSYEIMVESNMCQLCGFNPDKKVPKGMLNKIKRKFGLYRKTKINRPEFNIGAFL